MDKNLNQFENYDLLIICDCLINKRFLQNFKLDIPSFNFYFKKNNFDNTLTGEYLILNSSTTYITIIDKISDFCKNP